MLAARISRSRWHWTTWFHGADNRSGFGDCYLLPGVPDTIHLHYQVTSLQCCCLLLLLYYHYNTNIRTANTHKYIYEFNCLKPFISPTCCQRLQSVCFPSTLNPVLQPDNLASHQPLETMASVTEVHTHTDLVIAGHDDVLAAQRFKVGQLYVRLPAGLSVRGKQSVVLFHAEWLPLLFVLAPLNRQSPSVVDVWRERVISHWICQYVCRSACCWPVCFSTYNLSVCLSICLFVSVFHCLHKHWYLAIYLGAYLCVCLPVCLSVAIYLLYRYIVRSSTHIFFNLLIYKYTL